MSKTDFGLEAIEPYTDKMTALFTPIQMNELKEDRYKIHAKKMAERLDPFATLAVTFYAEQMRPASQRILDDLKYSDWAYAFEFNSYDFREIHGRGHALGDWPRTGTVLKRLDYDDYYNTSHYDIIRKRDPCGTMFSIGLATETMWGIWRWTDFRKRLLAELGLDPEHFEFKLLTVVTSGKERLFRNDDIPEYRNKIHLVYTQFPKKQ